jgi:hypothetical protein
VLPYGFWKMGRGNVRKDRSRWPSTQCVRTELHWCWVPPFFLQPRRSPSSPCLEESHTCCRTAFGKRGGETSVRTDPGGLAPSVSVRSCTGAGFLPFSCSLVGHRPVLVRVRRGYVGGESQKAVARSWPRPKKGCCPRGSPTFSVWSLVFLVGTLFHVRSVCVCGEGFRRGRLEG